MIDERVDDGGPAFPLAGKDNGGRWYVGGMSLRDYFAAHAMSEFIRDLLTDEKRIHGRLPMDVVAERSYSVADAMLKARSM